MLSGPLPKQGGQACPSSIRQRSPSLDKVPHVASGPLSHWALQNSGLWAFWVVWGQGKGSLFLPLSSRGSAAPTFGLGHQGKGP